MTSAESKFFELLRIALGTQKELISTISLEEWDEIAEIAAKQCVMGLLYSAIELLPKGQRPPNNILLAIHERVEEIEERNRYMNKLTYAASKRFEVDGFPNCVLKGQGIATLYPNPLRRESGDIDIWLKGDRDKIIEYVHKISASEPEKPDYLHIGFDLKDGTPVEAHFWPSFSSNPFINRRFQQWFLEEQDIQNKHYIDLPDNDKQIPVPTLSFNAIFILHHIFRHYIGTGVGFRQIVDYFYVLKHLKHEKDLFIQTFKQLLKDFGLNLFFSAVCWLYQELFGVIFFQKDFQANEKEGRKLLDEILICGNFGHSDQRYSTKEKPIQRAYKKRIRFFQLTTTYPKEYSWHLLKSLVRVVEEGN